MRHLVFETVKSFRLNQQPSQRSLSAPESSSHPCSAGILSVAFASEFRVIHCCCYSQSGARTIHEMTHLAHNCRSTLLPHMLMLPQLQTDLCKADIFKMCTSAQRTWLTWMYTRQNVNYRNYISVKLQSNSKHSRFTILYAFLYTYIYTVISIMLILNSFFFPSKWL